MTIPTSIAALAASTSHYDTEDMPVEAARAFIAGMVRPICENPDTAESVPLREALGRVLSEDVISPVNVPPHDNSAMDGYAFDGAQLVPGQALVLRSLATVMAGHAWAGQAGDGKCVRIMTGAVMPHGLDTVVPMELVTTGDDGLITVPADTVQAGANRRHAGEDLMRGGVALARGAQIGPAALGLLASLGLEHVRVVRRLKVAYFSTGDEILQPGEAPRAGAIYDSNRYSVFGLLTRMGIEVQDLGAVPDHPAQLEATLRHAASTADAVITSGGVSGGDADHTKALMGQLGEVAFWRVAMRPGRPLAVGWLDRGVGSALPGRCALFGLPGNPVAVMVAFLAFVRPALLRMMGCPHTDTPLLRAASAELMRKRPGRTEYQRGIVSLGGDGQLQVRTTGQQGSGMLSSMVQANGLIVLAHDRGTVQPGDPVDVMMFEGLL